MDTVQIIIVFAGVVAAVVFIIFWYYVYLITDEERSFEKPVNCIEKYIKKQRLIERYTPDKRRQIFLLNLMTDCEPFMNRFRHRINCELRLLDRIKRL